MATFMKSALVSALLLGLPLVSATAAHAASVTIESVVGSWTAVQGGKSVKGAGGDRIRWGKPVGQTRQSGYRFAAADGMPKANVAPRSNFELGTFTHDNFAIARHSGARGAQLSVDIGVRIGSERHTITTAFDFDHWETFNQASVCGNGGSNGSGVNGNGCADRVTAVKNEGLSETLSVNGDDYTFDITGLKGMSAFWTKEGASNSAKLFGSFRLAEKKVKGEKEESPVPVPAPVPLPAAIWLMGAGLGGLGVIGRRKRA